MKEKQPCRHLPEDDTDTTPPYYHINLLAPYFILPFIYCDGVARRDPRQATGGRLNAVAPPAQGPPEGGSRSKLPFSRPFPPRGSGARRAGVNLQPACTTCFTLLRERVVGRHIHADDPNLLPTKKILGIEKNEEDVRIDTAFQESARKEKRAQFEKDLNSAWADISDEEIQRLCDHMDEQKCLRPVVEEILYTRELFR